MAAGKPAKDRAGEDAAAAAAAVPVNVLREARERKDRSKAVWRFRARGARLPPMTRARTAEEARARMRHLLTDKRVRPSPGRSSRNRQGMRLETFRVNRRRRAAAAGGNARKRTKRGAARLRGSPALAGVAAGLRVTLSPYSTVKPSGGEEMA
jgi:hypothetical protein